MFGNKVMTALVTLKTMADQHSARGSLLKGVLVVVQCMRQCIVYSPGCISAKDTKVCEAGGNALHRAGSRFLPDGQQLTVSIP